MMSKSGCWKLCPVSLAIAIGLTAMLTVWVLSMWGPMIVGNEESAAYMQHIMLQGPMWKVYLIAFLKGAFFGFFIALFYDLCRMVCKGFCGKSKASCDCSCACCSGKK